MKRSFCFLLFGLIILGSLTVNPLLAAVQSPALDPNAPAAAGTKNLFTKETYPKVDGSTATIPLSEAMAVHLLGLTPVEARSFIKHNTTHNAYLNLIEGKADLILVTEPSPEELKLAQAKGLTLEVVPVVKDAFVFLVNARNPVDSLTIKQIQDIYQGKIKNWREVGGPDREILAYQRTPNSGSQTIMENMVMKGLKLAPPPREWIAAEMGELIDRVAGYDNSERSIGYSVYYFANAMYNKGSFKLLAVNAIKPNQTTIQNGSYPYTIAYYAVLNQASPAASPARKLLNWLLTTEGQAVALQAGYVPLK